MMEDRLIRAQIFESKKRLYALLLQLRNGYWTVDDLELGKVLVRDSEMQKLFETPLTPPNGRIE